jgi:hypothetical protein
LALSGDGDKVFFWLSDILPRRKCSKLSAFSNKALIKFRGQSRRPREGVLFLNVCVLCVCGGRLDCIGMKYDKCREPLEAPPYVFG